MNKNNKISVIKEDTGWYVATDIATGVASQGKTYESAVSNLEEALELYYENTTDCKDKSKESIVDQLYGVASNLDYKTLDDVRDDRLRKYVEPSVNSMARVALANESLRFVENAMNNSNRSLDSFRTERLSKYETVDWH